MAVNTLPVDRNNFAIQAGKSISAIVNTAIDTSGYVAISVPASTYCKGVVAKTRTGAPWLLATVASPTTYVTVTGPLSLALVSGDSAVLFYAKGTVTDTLEVILVD